VLFRSMGSEVRAAYGQLSDSSIESLERLVRLEWPDGIERDISDLSQELSLMASAARSIALATDLVGFEAGLSELASIQFKAAAIIRAKLGIPSNLTGERTSDC